MKMMRDSGRGLRRLWRRHAARDYVCGCPACDGVVIPLGSSRAAEKRSWRADWGIR